MEQLLQDRWWQIIPAVRLAQKVFKPKKHQDIDRGCVTDNDHAAAFSASFSS
jgi:hypothetical protein